jgi:hypothetical protein
VTLGGGSLIGSRDGHLSWREGLGYGAIAVVLGAAFPRLMSWVFWPARLGPRGLAAYIAFNTAMDFVVRTRVLPYLRRMAEERERARMELAQTLGREPTEDELVEHLGLTCKR